MKTLTLREQQIMSDIALGFTAKEIARALGLEHRTVEIYVSNIRKKLAARNSAHAVYLVLQHNLLAL